MQRRAAAIDIGTNSVLLLVAEATNERIAPIVDRATITRLGQGVDRTRRLAEDARRRTLDCLEQYAAIVKVESVSELDAVGTSALRDAEGADSFLSDAERVLGVRPRVIAGLEEAELGFEGALSGLAIQGEVLVADVGGGSTELVVGSALGATRRMRSAVSLDIGSVRLFERHVRSDPPTLAEMASVREDIRRAFAESPRPAERATLVGLAGTMTTLAAVELELEQYDADRVHGLRLSKLAIRALAERLAALPLVDRRRLPGLDPARADVIVAGAVIADDIVSWAGADEIVISDRGLRWALVERRLLSSVSPTGATG